MSDDRPTTPGLTEPPAIGDAKIRELLGDKFGGEKVPAGRRMLDAARPPADGLAALRVEVAELRARVEAAEAGNVEVHGRLGETLAIATRMAETVTLALGKNAEVLRVLDEGMDTLRKLSEPPPEFQDPSKN
jgi:hypothetical protein